MGKRRAKVNFILSSTLKIKILILTQYFPPEIGAPQNRLFGLAKALNKSKVDIKVLTAMPHYPQMVIHEKYQGKSFCYEKIDGIPIWRTKLFVSQNSSIISRLRNYFSFMWNSYFYGKKNIKEKFDFILCESPPLFLGISAYFLAKKLNAKIIFNVSDLWPESAEKLGIINNRFLLTLATKLEEWLYKKSTIITGQTNGIINNIKNRFPNKTTLWIPNGIDEEQFIDIPDYNFRDKNSFDSSDKLFFYGGIIGHAQGLEIILNAANLLRTNTKIHFILMGSGPEKPKLIKLKEKLKLTNVHFFDPIPKKDVLSVIQEMDASIVPLKSLALFLGAIPSKIFENLMLEKPIILGVDGEAKNIFIDETPCGLFYEPGNFKDLYAKIMTFLEEPEVMLQYGRNGKKLVSDKFNRTKISQELLDCINDHINE